ncbi:lipopolysaccharide biosynthesis protein [Boseongicola aestuarii]|uniref:Polysaccharide biosynthesis protein n=1 Tax=Boseongicola aestuarii TaxID=1470561 RepID=A0A238J4W6_9RHOB|nr:oligosaccharide flippase family protein [Boseongicola aestuarii]SMX25185.1 Polysaccharide biosynthesis protein [Boseongicola aestuarii]
MTSRATFRERFPGASSIIENGALLTGARWAETGIRAVYAVLIGRLLGPELYGAWSITLALYTFAIGFTHYGLESIIPLRLSRQKDAQSFIGTTLFVRLVLLATAAVFLALHVMVFVGDWFSRTALLIVLPALIGRGVVLWARSVFVGLEDNRVALQVTISMRLLELLFGLSCILVGYGLFALLALHAATWVIEAFAMLFALSRRRALALSFTEDEFRDIGARGAILGLGSIGMGALLSLPIILTRYVSGDITAVGQMAMSMQVASLVVMAVHSGFAASLPIVSRAISVGDPRVRYYSALTGLGVAVLFGFAVVAAQAFGPLVFSQLLGEEFALAGEWLTPALVSAGIMTLPTGVVQLLIAKQRVWSPAVASWVGALILVLTLPSLVRSQGPSGALYAAALGWAFYGAVLVAWSVATRDKQV